MSNIKLKMRVQMADEATGWVGYVQVSSAESKFTALARSVGDGMFYSLGGRKMRSLKRPSE